MKVEIGAFVFDPETGELTDAGGRTTLLHDKARLFLQTLVSAPGRLITRDAIRAALWDEGTFVDFDANIRIVVHKVREALGDSAEQPRYIETIPRRGYRLIANVARHEPPPRRTRIGMLALLSAGVLAVAAWSVAYLRGDATPKRVSILVMPFQAAGNAEAAALAAGLREELILRLGSIDASRLTVYAPATGDVAAKRRELSEQLHADFHLHGSVVGGGDRARFGMRLVQGNDDRVLWTGQWERDTSDLLALQSEIAGRVARAAVPRLSLSAPPERQTTRVPQAFAELAAGRLRWSEFDADGLRASLAHFERAVQLDQQYAAGWAGVADAHNFLALFGLEPTAQAFPAARAAAERAVALDPRGAEGHAALGMTLFHGFGALDEAERHYRRALELAPSRALTHQWMAGLYTAMRRPNDAVAAARRAHELDSLSLSVNSDLGWYLYYARRFDEAIRHSEKTLVLYPDASAAAYCIELSQRCMGRERQALEAMIARLRIEGRSEEQLRAVRDTARAHGIRRVWLEAARSGEQRREDAARQRYAIGVDYAWAGAADDAVRTLALARSENLSWVRYIDADPSFDTVRREVRAAR